MSDNVDTKAYIESGVIESYVLGLANDQEIAELRQLTALYPEIQAAIHAFETALEKQLQNAGSPAHENTRKMLFDRLDGTFAEEAPVRSFSRAGFVKYIAAAAVLLLVVSAALNVYFYNRFRSANHAFLALLTEKYTIAGASGAMQTQMLGMYENMQLMSDPAVAKISMASAPGTEGNLATVFWDTRTKDVYLLPNKLPAAPAGKQYQLWAIVNGKPVDAGMIDSCTGLCRMKNITAAQAFAVTLEKKGGNPSPEGQMYVLGKVG
ncbi:anti-sigma factor [Sediminibacterium soli]|uniref:anti-sigma factor n=1 Tax=Sediminibacterium soli TaxID=2698829 RepID=UPI00137955F3|nr:anti-sigma factor [Sediminibacterium soli]NCI47748.1 anti-sigma factor [Sediminibacterium soli]